jgi:NAD kinase
VVPRGRDVEVENRTVDVPAQVLVDGRPIAELGTGDGVVARLGEQSTLLAHLPESTFFRRYKETFAS